jgi:hypothetical protein
MAQPRKRKTPHRDEEAEKPPKTEQALCWLCSRPLASEPVKSMLGHGGLPVHQRCYDKAVKS